MTIETKFSNGDVVWIRTRDGVMGPCTIGQVRVAITDSPGIEGEELFDNYKAQKNYLEQYMCVETGIGTGTLWYYRNLYASEEEAAKASFFDQYV